MFKCAESKSVSVSDALWMCLDTNPRAAALKGKKEERKVPLVPDGGFCEESGHRVWNVRHISTLRLEAEAYGIVRGGGGCLCSRNQESYQGEAVLFTQPEPIAVKTCHSSPRPPPITPHRETIKCPDKSRGRILNHEREPWKHGVHRLSDTCWPVPRGDGVNVSPAGVWWGE